MQICLGTTVVSLILISGVAVVLNPFPTIIVIFVIVSCALPGLISGLLKVPLLKVPLLKRLPSVANWKSEGMPKDDKGVQNTTIERILAIPSLPPYNFRSQCLAHRRRWFLCSDDLSIC